MAQKRIMYAMHLLHPVAMSLHLLIILVCESVNTFKFNLTNQNNCVIQLVWFVMEVNKLNTVSLPIVTACCQFATWFYF